MNGPWECPSCQRRVNGTLTTCRYCGHVREQATSPFANGYNGGFNDTRFPNGLDGPDQQPDYEETRP